MTITERVLHEFASDEMATLQQIADRVGISREYVRQIGSSSGIDIQARRQARTFAKAEARKHPPRGNWWVALVRRWLLEIGHGYCCSCHQAKPIYQMVSNGGDPLKQRVCGVCLALRIKSAPSQQYEQAKVYRLSHREQNNRHHMAYQRRRLERIKAQGPEALAAERARLAAYARSTYWRRKGMEPPATCKQSLQVQETLDEV